MMYVPISQTIATLFSDDLIRTEVSDEVILFMCIQVHTFPYHRKLGSHTKIMRVNMTMKLFVTIN